MITKPTTWTAERVMVELNGIEKELLDNKSIVFIGEMFETRDYPCDYYSRWARVYSDNDEICRTIKRIDSILCSRINIGGLKGKLNAAMVIFNLKNNYGWKDQTHIEQKTENTNTNFNAELDPEDEETQEMIKMVEATMFKKHSDIL